MIVFLTFPRLRLLIPTQKTFQIRIVYLGTLGEYSQNNVSRLKDLKKTKPCLFKGSGAGSCLICIYVYFFHVVDKPLQSGLIWTQTTVIPDFFKNINFGKKIIIRQKIFIITQHAKS